MTFQTKILLLSLTSLFGDVLRLFAYFQLGYFAGSNVPGLSRYVCMFGLFLFGSGAKILSNMASKKSKTIGEPVLTGDPYRDATAAVHARVAALEAQLAEEKAVKVKPPFPIEPVAFAFMAGMLVLCGIAFLGSWASGRQKVEQPAYVANGLDAGVSFVKKK